MDIEIVKNSLWQKYRGPVLIGLAVVMLLAICFFGYSRISDAESRYQQAVQIAEKHMTDSNALHNELNLRKQNADLLAQFALRAQQGQVQPINHFTVTAPTLPAAAQQIQERINKRDPTLPAAALEKTDRTAVVANETQQKVDVYKYNGYRNWEWSVGAGLHDGDAYVPIGLQRNYSKDAAVAGEIHTDGKTVNGVELKYIRKTDKLFLLF